MARVELDTPVLKVDDLEEINKIEEIIPDSA